MDDARSGDPSSVVCGLSSNCKGDLNHAWLLYQENRGGGNKEGAGRYRPATLPLSRLEATCYVVGRLFLDRLAHGRDALLEDGAHFYFEPARAG
jgi:hypothetical protein